MFASGTSLGSAAVASSEISTSRCAFSIMYKYGARMLRSSPQPSQTTTVCGSVSFAMRLSFFGDAPEHFRSRFVADHRRQLIFRQLDDLLVLRTEVFDGTVSALDDDAHRDLLLDSRFTTL